MLDQSLYQGPFQRGQLGRHTEVDFIIQDSDGEIVPIEVKPGDRTNSRSLTKLRDRYSPRSSIRLSSKNFGLEEGLYSIPLYAAFCIDKDWAKKVET
ncbi:ATPase [methanogenic archaeon mixed culture ISO4-G1]|nr:ATPase [methanogenic archaeon mixed culture ISO4-G1]